MCALPYRAISDSNFVGTYLFSGILCVPFPKNWEGNSTERRRVDELPRNERNYITFSFFIHVVEIKIIYLSSFRIDFTFSTEVTHPRTHTPAEPTHTRFSREIRRRYFWSLFSFVEASTGGEWTLTRLRYVLRPNENMLEFRLQTKLLFARQAKGNFPGLISLIIKSLKFRLLWLIAPRVDFDEPRKHNLWGFMQPDYIKGSLSNLVTICRLKAISTRRQNLHKRIFSETHFPERKDIHKIVNGRNEKHCCCHYSHKSHHPTHHSSP